MLTEDDIARVRLEEELRRKIQVRSGLYCQVSRRFPSAKCQASHRFATSQTPTVQWPNKSLLRQKLPCPTSHFKRCRQKIFRRLLGHWRYGSSDRSECGTAAAMM